MSRTGHASANKATKLLLSGDRHLQLTMFFNIRLRNSCIQTKMMLYTSSPLNTTCQVKRNPTERDRHNNGITLKRTFPYPLISPISRKKLTKRKSAKKGRLARSVHIFTNTAQIARVLHSLWWQALYIYRSGHAHCATTRELPSCRPFSVTQNNYTPAYKASEDVPAPALDTLHCEHLRHSRPLRGQCLAYTC